MTSLLVGLGVLLVIACLIAIYAFRKMASMAIAVLLLMICSSGVMYWQWGAYAAIKQLAEREAMRAQTQQALKQYNGPMDVIARMEQHLKQKPESAKGWYLLGRLYQSQQLFSKATVAFGKAYQYDKKDLKIRLQYMESLYIDNNQTQTALVSQILTSILKEDPYQLDALNFAATDAYTHKEYGKASSYWQKMLTVLADGTKEKQAILKAIAMAQQKEKKNVK